MASCTDNHLGEFVSVSRFVRKNIFDCLIVFVDESQFISSLYSLIFETVPTLFLIGLQKQYNRKITFEESINSRS